ncbi:hypothetical protein MLD38_008370 [Melastoma candidum]|uniref:Uncharacterized protein n=1 Tax=Melastoma candidum TaxID=119954 RepID=A0ACB9RVD2_9MYRT|nr:hypothetical protein MLD38_008370 [Melastoma candidum]
MNRNPVGKGSVAGAGEEEELVGALRGVGFLGKEGEGSSEVAFLAKGLDELVVANFGGGGGGGGVVKG